MSEEKPVDETDGNTSTGVKTQLIPGCNSFDDFIRVSCVYRFVQKKQKIRLHRYFSNNYQHIYLFSFSLAM